MLPGVPVSNTDFLRKHEWIMTSIISCVVCNCSYMHLLQLLVQKNRRCREGMGELFMMTSSNENIFHVTGHLRGTFTGHRWITRTKASNAELWYIFFLCVNKRLSKQWWGWWFETPSCFYNVTVMYITLPWMDVITIPCPKLCSG